MINYIVGDVTAPRAVHDTKIIVHCCNDAGAWGAGFVLALSRRWKSPEQEYRRWYLAGETSNGIQFALGQVQFVQVSDRTFVANLIGQHGVGLDSQGLPPIRYDAIRVGLKRVAGFAREISASMGREASVHMPRMGAGLAGGDWNKIALIIDDELCSTHLQVTVYDLASKSRG